MMVYVKANMKKPEDNNQDDDGVIVTLNFGDV